EVSKLNFLNLPKNGLEFSLMFCDQYEWTSFMQGDGPVCCTQMQMMGLNGTCRISCGLHILGLGLSHPVSCAAQNRIAIDLFTKFTKNLFQGVSYSIFLKRNELGVTQGWQEFREKLSVVLFQKTENKFSGSVYIGVTEEYHLILA
ncbi:hypothetical protein ACJX0J_007990, partial [Zea mays]